MLLTFIIIALVLGLAGYFIKQRYDAVSAKIKQVEAARKQVNQALNERHTWVKKILQTEQAQQMTAEPIKQLAALRKRIKAAHAAEDELAMIQNEVLISENNDALLPWLQQQGLQEIYKAYEQSHANLQQAVKLYHEQVETYDQIIEQFAESVLIAVFEKDLFRKFPTFELEEEDTLTDDFI